MREINLINPLDYNTRYLQKEENDKKVIDTTHYIVDTIKLSKNVYKADEIVSIPEENKKSIENVTNNFIETFKNRGGATKEQINFANETAKIVYGDLKENIITVIPAPCGFGKSSITLEILKNQIQLYKDDKTTDGIIIVTDRLESLKETEKELNQLGLKGYTYVLESWNPEMCKNKKIKQSDAKICSFDKCPYFTKCKIFTQQKDQEKFPILLITNARLKECGESINRYKEYENGIRTTLLIDERPSILDFVKVNTGLLNDIGTEISKTDFEHVKEKTELENKWKRITGIISNKMQSHREEYKRFIISNINNDIICKNDKEFMKLWDKYMKNKFKRELEHIHRVLTQGGFYVYEKNHEFIATVGSKNLREIYCSIFKTLIFDGTALYDPLYLNMYNNDDIKFLDIENTRLYKNLTINAHVQIKINKTTFKNKKYLSKACASFVNNEMNEGFKKNGYVISYKEQSIYLARYINDKIKGRIAKLNDDECHYFGNTKGKNDIKDCNVMFQFGWETLPDYDYVLSWLSMLGNWDKLLEYCKDLEKAKEFSDDLIIKNRPTTDKYVGGTYGSFYNIYEFGAQPVNHFKMLSIVTNFYQEVHRTKLRNYTCTEEEIKINVFAQQAIILSMIKQLFPRCKLNYEKKPLACFQESKADNRKNKGENYLKFKNWLDKQNKDRQVTSKELYSETGLNTKTLNKLKEKNSFVSNWFKEHSIKKGIYTI